MRKFNRHRQLGQSLELSQHRTTPKLGFYTGPPEQFFTARLDEGAVSAPCIDFRRTDVLPDSPGEPAHSRPVILTIRNERLSWAQATILDPTMPRSLARRSVAHDEETTSRPQ